MTKKVPTATVITTLMGFVVGLCAGGFGFLAAYLAERLGMAYTGIGLLLATYGIAAIACPFLLSLVADRFAKRRVMAVICAIAAVGAAWLGATDHVGMILLCIGLLGASNSCCEAFVNVLVSAECKESSGRLINLAQLLFSIGAFVAPMLIPALFGSPSRFHLFFPLLGVAYGAGCVAHLLTSRAKGHADVTAEADARQKPAWRVSRLFWLSAAALFVYCGAESAIGGYLVPLFSSEGWSAGSSGKALSLFYLSTMMLRLFGALFASNQRRMGRICYFAMAMALTVMFFCRSSHLMLLFCALAGLSAGPIWPALMDEVARAEYPHSARALTFLQSLSALGTVLIPFAAGLLSDRHGVRSVYLFLPGLLFIIVIVFFASDKSGFKHTEV